MSLLFYFVPFLIRFNYNTVMKLHILQLSFAHVTSKEFKSIRNGEVLKESTVKKLVKAKTISLSYIKETLSKHGVTFITQQSEFYPQLLKQIYDPPYVLYVKGDLKVLQTNFLGVVGSRKASAYTTHVLKKLLPSLKSLSIVSGLAYGADDIAHYISLENGLNTVGVLAFGHDIHYPTSTFKTRQRMEEVCCTISEYPPGTQINKYQFVERNRIIAGMSHGVLVTEAEEKSGSLITLEMAMDENRYVFCVPGNITSPLSIGVNERLKEGAILVTNSDDILIELNI